jgi:threonyl-tRNA synthetase
MLQRIYATAFPHHRGASGIISEFDVKRPSAATHRKLGKELDLFLDPRRRPRLLPSSIPRDDHPHMSLNRSVRKIHDAKRLRGNQDAIILNRELWRVGTLGIITGIIMYFTKIDDEDLLASSP